MHEMGEGVPQYYKTAVKWYTLAAKQLLATLGPERVRIGADRGQSGTARENLTGTGMVFPDTLPDTQQRLVEFAAPGLRRLLGYGTG